jgi:hypothetical protein
MKFLNKLKKKKKLKNNLINIAYQNKDLIYKKILENNLKKLNYKVKLLNKIIYNYSNFYKNAYTFFINNNLKINKQKYYNKKLLINFLKENIFKELTKTKKKIEKNKKKLKLLLKKIKKQKKNYIVDIIKLKLNLTYKLLILDLDLFNKIDLFKKKLMRKILSNIFETGYNIAYTMDISLQYIYFYYRKYNNNINYNIFKDLYNSEIINILKKLKIIIHHLIPQIFIIIYTPYRDLVVDTYTVIYDFLNPKNKSNEPILNEWVFTDYFIYLYDIILDKFLKKSDKNKNIDKIKKIKNYIYINSIVRLANNKYINKKIKKKLLNIYFNYSKKNKENKKIILYSTSDYNKILNKNIEKFNYKFIRNNQIYISDKFGRKEYHQNVNKMKIYFNKLLKNSLFYRPKKIYSRNFPKKKKIKKKKIKAKKKFNVLLKK